MWRKLLFFCLLYFVQGAALAYVINFQKPYLSAEGISKETLGLFTSLLLLPFILKVALGYLSDRFPLGRWGSRKPYMIMGLSLFGGCYLGLSFLKPAENFFVFAVVTWFASLGLAWFDTCADGWAVDIATDQEQSSIQAAMIAGKSAGLILMSASFGFLAERFGFALIFQIISGLAFLILGMVLIAGHRPRKKTNDEVIKHLSDLFSIFYIFFALYAIVYSVASFGTDGLLTLFLAETKQATSRDIGFFGMSRGIGALIGAVAFALVRPRLGLRTAQYLALAALGIGCLLPQFQLPNLIMAVSWGVVWGFQETAFVTVAMRFAKGPFAATLFAGSMIFSNLGTSLGEALGTPLVPRLGFEGVFLVFSGLAWFSLVFIPKVFQPLGKD